ncbi:hypothetical protein DFQ30_007841 [Apophysomyces sp. BC1015]|nr:hypothetical protein DFQ30_007841 [Apophysomyces sp. BC1015]
MDNVPPGNQRQLALSDMDPSMLDDLEIWGIDHGVTQVFVASNGCDPHAYINDNELTDEPSLATPDNPRHKIRQFSAAEYYCLAGFPKTNTKIREWKDLYGIPQLESSIGSPKTSSLQGIIYVLDLLLEFYGTDAQQLKFLNYRGRQKANDEMVKIFTNGGIKYGPHRERGNSLEVFERRRKTDGTLRRRRCQWNQTEALPPPSAPRAEKWRPLPYTQTPKIPLLCAGDGRFNRRTFRNKPHGLAKTFRKVLKQAQRQHLLMVVDVNSSWTSKVCSKYGSRGLENVLLDEDDQSSKLHSVVCCKACHTMWQRDYNASRNICAIALFAIYGFRPLVFTNDYGQETEGQQGQNHSPHPGTRNLLDE